MQNKFNESQSTEKVRIEKNEGIIYRSGKDEKAEN